MKWIKARNALLGLAFGVLLWAAAAVLWPLAVTAFAWTETDDAD